MLGTFALAGLVGSQISANQSAGRSGERAAHKVQNLQAQIRILEANLAKSLMINEALWEILKEKAKLTDEHLNEKLYQIDMRDGKLDGKNQRAEPTNCPNCNRAVSPRHPACIYCGHVIDESVFHLG